MPKGSSPGMTQVNLIYLADSKRRVTFGLNHGAEKIESKSRDHRGFKQMCTRNKYIDGFSANSRTPQVVWGDEKSYLRSANGNKGD